MLAHLLRADFLSLVPLLYPFLFSLLVLILLSYIQSVLGADSNSGMTNGGLRLNKVKNVIIRGLRMTKSPAPVDLIGVQGQSTNVWIDHCYFESVSRPFEPSPSPFGAL